MESQQLFWCREGRAEEGVNFYNWPERGERYRVCCFGEVDSGHQVDMINGKTMEPLGRHSTGRTLDCIF